MRRSSTSSKKTASWYNRKLSSFFFFFAHGRVRVWTTKFGINRTAGANATSKTSNPQEMTAPRTRVILFRGVHPFQSVDTSAWYTRLRSGADARRIANFTPKTNHRGPVVWCSTKLRPSRLFASSLARTRPWPEMSGRAILFILPTFYLQRRKVVYICSIISKSFRYIGTIVHLICASVH